MLWLIAAVVLAIGELATTSFFLAPFAAGAGVAAILAATDAGATVEWAAFLVVSIVLLAAMRRQVGDDQIERLAAPRERGVDEIGIRRSGHRYVIAGLVARRFPRARQHRPLRG